MTISAPHAVQESTQPAPSQQRRRRRLPFKAQVALVWIAILTLIAILFAQAGFDVQWMQERAFSIAQGVWVTILFSVLAITLAIVVGVALALGRISTNAIAYGISGFYVSFFRGTPLIVQLFLWYLALPQLALGIFPQDIAEFFILPAQVAGVLGIGLNYAAYLAEIFRSGIQAVPYGQTEAAHTLGLTNAQTVRRIVLPQAIRIAIPPTGNEFIAMMKDTALIGLLGTTLLWADPFRVAQLEGRSDFKNLEALIVAALVYWGLTAIFSAIQARIERRLSRGYVRLNPKEAK